jgi:hypothetical protein
VNFTFAYFNNCPKEKPMQKFRKRPVEIEAVQWTGDIEAFRHWIDELGGLPFTINKPYSPECSIKIDTLEGIMEAKPRDWIIRGVKGEFYPCKPDIFAATYDPVPGGSFSIGT